MSLKPLARTGLGVLTAVAALALTQGAGPAAADIAATTVTQPHGEEVPVPISEITIAITDANPVWVTLNGTVLTGGPITPKGPYATAAGVTYYSVVIALDCVNTPLHVVAAQKNAAGAITSQMSADYTPAPAPASGSAALNNMTTGSGNGAAQADQGCHIRYVL
ncbi:hypothetical protein [Nocardia tengchongensis]|uniref:hypothetical protein n=1 Tax=Nocardia tengchongensis TaxID=2055889 RepID=UPI0036AD6CD5